MIFIGIHFRPLDLNIEITKEKQCCAISQNQCGFQSDFNAGCSNNYKTSFKLEPAKLQSPLASGQAKGKMFRCKYAPGNHSDCICSCSQTLAVAEALNPNKPEIIINVRVNHLVVPLCWMKCCSYIDVLLHANLTTLIWIKLLIFLYVFSFSPDANDVLITKS